MNKKIRKSALGVLSASAILLATTGQSFASDILFGFVGTGYHSNGEGISDFLTADGHTVTEVDLWSTTLGSLSGYDQIWVYDLSTGNDTTATHMANYQTIANWFAPATHDLIVDGRIISSNYTTHSEPAWIQNYATQLEARSGGLVLGTDHNVFTAGINSLAAMIGVDPFTGNFYQPPYEATVDPLSPLFTAAGVHPCSTGSEDCVWDHSSTSFTATGQQTPDIFLTPVAYHGHISPGNFASAYDQAAIASTLGSETFGTCGGIDQPPCVTCGLPGMPACEGNVPAPASLALLALGLAGIGCQRRKQQKVA